MSVRSYKQRYTEDPVQEGRTATGLSTAIQGGSRTLLESILAFSSGDDC